MARVRPFQAAAEAVPYRRSPVFLGRALAFAGALGALLIAPHVLDRSVEGLVLDVRQAGSGLGRSTGTLIDSAAVVAALVIIGVGLAQQVLWRRLRYLAVVSGAVLAAAGLYLVVTARVDEVWVPTELAERRWMAVVAAGAAAMITVSDWWPRALARAGAAALVVPTLVASMWATGSLPARLVVLTFGGLVGSIVALVGGSPSSRPTTDQVVRGLEAAGLPVAGIEPLAVDARGSVPWVVELATGRTVFVKAQSTEEHFADRLFRLWRRVRLRSAGDRRVERDRQRAVEHEAFVASRAGAVGVPTPRVLAIGSLPDGGALAAYEMVDGRSLDRLGAEVTEPQLRQAWSALATMHRQGITHRDLRAANLVVDRDGAVWVVDFAFAEVGAGEEAQHRDRAELLASTAAAIGPERAVAVAVASLGPGVWEETLPYVQPLAVSSATRSDLDRSGFAGLRTVLAQRLGIAQPTLPRLSRLDARAVATVLALGVAVWVLLPQVADAGDLWEMLPRADRGLLALTALCSFVTYVGAGLSIRGAVADDLPVVPTFLAQMASSFVNRITPARVGGMATNARWLVKEGVDTPAATAAVAVNALSGGITHATLMLVTVVWAGRVGLGAISLPSPAALARGGGLILGCVALTYAVPPLRQFLHRRVWPRARQSLDAIATVARRPDRLLSLFGGSVLVTVANIAGLALALSAVGASVALSSVALVYLAGSVVASAAPTPGGLGATEAVLVAALTTLGVAQQEAGAGVLVYRFATVWLPILPGWLSLQALERMDRI